MTDQLERVTEALRDRYAVERELGRGGMATVYLARELKHDRLVAVKVLHPELAAALGVERFLREIQITAKLNHPHVLPLYDSGDTNGVLYYVMPYVEGESLRDRLRRDTQLPLEEAVQVACEVADGLSYAHSHGLVHRDIKPENIMLAGGHALVADFGIGRALGMAGADRLTATGIALGTPAYMSPEQWSASGTIDGRTDLYGLCCVAYEMLVGEPPFSGPSVQAILARHSTEPVPSIRVVRPTVPAAVEAVIAKGLAKVPADRFSTAHEFEEALRTAEQGAEAVPSSGRPSPVARTGPTLPRLRVMAPTTAVLVATTAAAIIFLPKLTARNVVSLVQQRVVVDALENQTGDPALDPIGRMTADWLTQSLQRTGIVDVVPSPTALEASRFVRAELQVGRLRDPIRGLADETGAGIVISGAYYREGGGIQLSVQVTDATRGRLLDALEPILADPDAPAEAVERLRARVTGSLAVSLDDRLARQTGTAVQPPTFAAYRAFDQGMTSYVLGNYEAALPHFHQAFALDTSFVLPLLYAAFSQSNLGNRRATDSLADLVARGGGRLSDHDRHWIEYLQARMDGDNEQALRAIRRAAQLAPGSKAVYNTAYIARVTNRPREALAALETLDPRRGAMRGWLPYWLNMTDALHRLGDHKRELGAAREARRLHPDRVEPLVFEALALAALGRVAAVDGLLEEIERLHAAHVTLGGTFRDVAAELRHHGHEARARALLDRAVQWFAAQPLPSPESIPHIFVYATTLYDAGRWVDAEALVQQLLRAAPDSIGYRALSGLLAARRGERDSARAVSTWLATLQRPYLFGTHTAFRARIAAALGGRDETVALLRQAFSEGHFYSRHLYPELLDLRDYAPLRELLKPKG